MTSGFKRRWLLYFALSFDLDGWAFGERSPSQPELRHHDVMDSELRGQEQQPLSRADKSGPAGNESKEYRFHDLPSQASPSPPAAVLADPRLPVRVLVYNYAQVSPEKQAKAKKRAGLIFREVGIELVWVEHASGITRLDEIDLILRILPEPRRSLASQKALGEALPCGLSREGCIASVFYNRTQELARSRDISSDEVLGHAMAHELGHLLLGSDSHSARGLMQNTWDSGTLRMAAKGDLVFTREQSGLLRLNVLARSKSKRLSSP